MGRYNTMLSMPSSLMGLTLGSQSPTATARACRGSCGSDRQGACWASPGACRPFATLTRCTISGSVSQRRKECFLVTLRAIPCSVGEIPCFDS
jgi:hypothetical protein